MPPPAFSAFVIAAVSSENEVTTVPLLVSVVELPEDELPEPDEAELST